MTRRGPVKEKILLLLLGGLTLGLTKSPRGYLKTLNAMHAEWRKINHRTLIRSIRNLYRSNLLEQKNNRDGTTTFVLSKDGRQIAMTYNLDKMFILKTKWDKRWRLVIFDIPEKLKKVRDTLRYQLKRLGFVELQHSVFVLPFECKSEIEYIIEFYNIRKCVRYIEANYIDNELDLKHKFRLS